jgi:maleylacetate reductase
MALRDLGLEAADLDRAADLAVQEPYWNPRPVERDAIRQLLERAWAGDAPQL